MGADPAQGEPSPPAEERDQPLSHWKPLLVNVCVATVLTAGAYICYRVSFHSRTCWPDRTQKAWPSPGAVLSAGEALSPSRRKQVKGFQSLEL